MRLSMPKDIDVTLLSLRSDVSGTMLYHASWNPRTRESKETWMMHEPVQHSAEADMYGMDRPAFSTMANGASLATASPMHLNTSSKCTVHL